MPFFTKKPVTIEAHQWHQNGDHPDDYADRGYPDIYDCEGMVVRRYRHPGIPGDSLCPVCGLTMDDHGFIDTKEGGHRVCPGDWIITGVQGEHYPCKPDIFKATYDPAS